MNDNDAGISVEGLTVRFIVRGAAEPKDRARGGGGRHYTTEKTSKYEKRVGQEAALVMRGRPLFVGPVVVDIFAAHLVPRSWPKKRKESETFKTSSPDLDNIIKALMDGMNKIVYVDDSQVVSIHASKYYGPVEQVEIIVRSQGLQENSK